MLQMFAMLLLTSTWHRHAAKPLRLSAAMSLSLQNINQWQQQHWYWVCGVFYW
jgi:hypothetical protein